MSQKIAVIGGGFAGGLIAKLLAQFGYRVHLFERHAQLMQGATNRNMFRQHLGQHYPLDDQTAFGVMEASLVGASYMRGFFYPDVPGPEYYILDKPFMQLTLADGTKLSPGAFLAALKRRQRHYASLLPQFPEAEAIFGPADEYFGLIGDPSRHMRGAHFGVRSNERVVDIALLVSSLIAEIESDRRITIHRAQEVTDVRPADGGFVLTVRDVQTGRVRSHEAFQVVQAGWCGGVELDLRLFNHARIMRGQSAVSAAHYCGDTKHRLKVYPLVRGCDISPHRMTLSPQPASYAYVGDGVGVLEGCPNILRSVIGVRPLEWDELHRDREWIEEIGRQIFEYCRSFLPSLDDAFFVGAFLAEVISGLDSGKRSTEVLRQTGLEELEVHGFHSIAGMKLSNIPVAAFTAVKRILEVDGQDVGVMSAEAFMRMWQERPGFRIAPASPDVIARITRSGARDRVHTVEALRLRSGGHRN